MAGAVPPGMSDLVPCDCVLLSGSAVVNEASLTGESVPQMKESFVVAVPSSSVENGTLSSKLDINGLHRVNTLFSGTTLVTVDGVTHGAGKLH